MHPGNPDLVDYVRETIRQRGPVSFAWFMEQALYHPELGYYSSGRCAIGRRGDYFTNVSVGPLFGRLLAAQFGEMWKSLGQPDDFVIVEQGAHQGDCSQDVLVALRDRAPDFFSALRYRIVEPFPILRERQRETLRGFMDKLEWKESLADLEPFCGVHFSNELLDAMPVHLLSRAGNGWQERCVAELGDDFGFVTAGIGDADLLRRSQIIPRHSGEPYETELNLVALQWMEQLAPKLACGYVVAVDYGYSRDEYYAPERRSGTLQCFSKHRILPSPLTEIGYADITAHVDWTSLAGRAETCGLSVGGFTDQHHFATGVVTQLMPDQFGASADARTRRALQTLLHPEILGTTFQFLALMKNVPSSAQLSGYKFARDPRVALGLPRRACGRFI